MPVDQTSQAAVPQDDVIWFATQARVGQGLIGKAVEGTLAITLHGRLVHFTRETAFYSWMLWEINEIRSPMLGSGTMFSFQARGSKYRVGFLGLSPSPSGRSLTTGMDLDTALHKLGLHPAGLRPLSEMHVARRMCRAWMAVFVLVVSALPAYRGWPAS